MEFIHDAIETLRRDVRLAVRSLGKSPVFAATALLTIALAIGATASVFSVVHGILLDPLPYPEPSRLAIIWQTDAHNDSWEETASYPDYLDWKREARSFSTLAGTTTVEVNLLPRDGSPVRLQGVAASHDFFDVLGVRPAVGRAFTPEEDAMGGPQAVILSWALWRDRFGSDPGVVGTSIRLDGADTTVVGVTGESFWLGQQADLLVPLRPVLGTLGEVRGVHNVAVWGRIAPGVTRDRAQEEMSAISAELERLYPDDNVGRGANVEPLHEAAVGDVRRPLIVLFAAAVLVLLIGCANVAGLLIARGVARNREMAIRASLGARRWTIFRQLVVESLTLSLLGGAAGVLLAFWGVRVLLAMAPETIPRLANVGLNPSVLGFALLVSLGSGLLFGTIPAFRISRQALAWSVRDAERGSAARRSGSRQLLVAGEIALAVILTIGAGLLLRTFWNLIRVEPGFQPRGLMTFDVSLPQASYPVPSRTDYPNWPTAIRFYDRFLEELRATPGVESAALAMHHPLRRGWTSTIRVVGRERTEGPQDEQRVRSISPGYFATIGTPILRGRDVSAEDGAGRPLVTVINQAFVDRYFPGEEPLGQRLLFWGQQREIVGVVANVRFRRPREESEPAIYPPLAQVPMGEVAVVVRAGSNPLVHFGAVRAALARADREIATSNVRTLGQILGDSIGTVRFQMVLIALFGATALLLAAIGTFGLIAYQVEQRRREIGVRMALGADRGNVVGMVVSEAARMAAAGLAAGLAGALVLTRFLETTLFGVGTRDLAVYAGAVVLLAAVALVASWIPARRAGGVDPVTVLRWE
ncbi:MAG TPA: ABC transporter permease [Thermoanaerobaculia bacterium]|nr:ABC transporter permease [Thermoanaerobaculia bacterium]